MLILLKLQQEINEKQNLQNKRCVFMYTIYVLNAKTRNSSEIILSVFRHRFYDIHT